MITSIIIRGAINLRRFFQEMGVTHFQTYSADYELREEIHLIYYIYFYYAKSEKTSSMIELWICKFFNQSLQYCYRLLEAILTHFISSSCAPIYENVCLLLEKGC